MGDNNLAAAIAIESEEEGDKSSNSHQHASVPPRNAVGSDAAPLPESVTSERALLSSSQRRRSDRKSSHAATAAIAAAVRDDTRLERNDDEMTAHRPIVNLEALSAKENNGNGKPRGSDDFAQGGVSGSNHKKRVSVASRAARGRQKRDRNLWCPVGLPSQHELPDKKKRAKRKRAPWDPNSEVSTSSDEAREGEKRAGRRSSSSDEKFSSSDEERDRKTTPVLVGLKDLEAEVGLLSWENESIKKRLDRLENADEGRTRKGLFKKELSI